MVAKPVNPEIVTIVQPSPGLRLAMDPRIPDDHESFMFILSDVPGNSKVEWYVDDKLAAVTNSGDYLWPVSKGSHTVMAKVHTKGIKTQTQPVTFLVK
jgi:penicillin-binding protein 1C